MEKIVVVASDKSWANRTITIPIGKVCFDDKAQLEVTREEADILIKSGLGFEEVSGKVKVPDNSELNDDNEPNANDNEQNNDEEQTNLTPEEEAEQKLKEIEEQKAFIVKSKSRKELNQIASIYPKSEWGEIRDINKLKEYLIGKLVS